MARSAALGCTPLPRQQIAERIIAHADTNEAKRRVAHGGGHPTHLPVAPLAKRQFQPRRRDVLAKPHGRMARPKVGRHVEQARAGRARRAVVQLYAAFEPKEGVGIGEALDLNEVDLLLPETGVGESLLKPTVVGEQHEAFAVVIETSGRINLLHGHEIRQRRPFGAIGRELADDAERFVEQQKHRALERSDVERSGHLADFEDERRPGVDAALERAELAQAHEIRPNALKNDGVADENLLGHVELIVGQKVGRRAYEAEVHRKDGEEKGRTSASTRKAMSGLRRRMRHTKKEGCNGWPPLDCWADPSYPPTSCLFPEKTPTQR